MVKKLRMHVWVLIFSIAALITGAELTSAQGASLKPNGFGSLTINDYLGPKGVACGVDQRGLASTFRGFALPVGFEDSRWGNRRRCKRSLDQTFTASVQFDLTELPADYGRVESAHLLFKALTPQGGLAPTGPVPEDREFASYLRDGEGEESFIEIHDNCRQRERGEAQLWELHDPPLHYRGIASVRRSQTPIVGRQTRNVSNNIAIRRFPATEIKRVDEFRFQDKVARVDITDWIQQQLDEGDNSFSIVFEGYAKNGRGNDRCVSVLYPENIEILILPFRSVDEL